MTALRSSPARGLALPLETLVFAVGMSTLGAEIAAQRLMAPFFGSSTVIWANTIAVVLLALSVGYWLGGRLADRRPTADALNGLVVLGSALLAVVPFIAHPFLSLSVSAFDDLSVGAFTASLFGTLVLVAVPLLLLGAVSPWAMRLKVASVEESGVVAGRLYAISTVGSLVGVFFVSLWAIEAIGTQRTFLVLAAVPALVSAARLGGAWLTVPAVLLAALALPPGTTKPADNGRVLYEKETPYQYARVVESPDGTRKLELNEGQAIHSLWRPGTVMTGGYWDGYLVLPFVTGSGKPPGRIAVLGTAGGTVPRAYAELFPSTLVDAVDIDPELFKIGQRYFGLKPRPQLREFAQDARPFLRGTAERYDSIFVDAYRQPYIPFYLTTREFFTLVRDRLKPGGSVIINIGHPADSDALEKALSATLGKVFAHVARDPIQAENSLVIASDVQLSSAALREAPLPAVLNPVAALSAERLRPALRGGDVFTDDRAPVEWLIDASIVSYAAGETGG
ncbi:fused MFS/spermidine synthase [Solirubrobacter ginsenosidimutans]|uniref:Fused MFS/spermidine synthase n=1 Tax=Solirubrobacter ginsenosidimutans TaxID=490573 RepID=A0A9X3MTG2_9ACTN|nr:fused MFS/spermidine synthase [Solirubrobacter ginsenosidimutans]MDA0162711.1 fused MFS/spermidine synthase [Solirubrobacter ginsenosidimutans]